MTQVVIEQDEHQERLLRRRAAEEKRTPQDLCREAVARYLGDPAPESPDRYESFRKMIGLVDDGPADASVLHDHRPEDGPRRPLSSTPAAGSPSSSGPISITRRAGPISRR